MLTRRHPVDHPILETVDSESRHGDDPFDRLPPCTNNRQGPCPLTGSRHRGPRWTGWRCPRQRRARRQGVPDQLFVASGDQHQVHHQLVTVRSKRTYDGGDRGALCWTAPGSPASAPCSDTYAGAIRYGYEADGNQTTTTPPSGAPRRRRSTPSTRPPGSPPAAARRRPRPTWVPPRTAGPPPPTTLGTGPLNVTFTRTVLGMSARAHSAGTAVTRAPGTPPTTSGLSVAGGVLRQPSPGASSIGVFADHRS